MTGGIEASQAEQDLKAPEDFLVGNQDLEQLEALLDRFNVFEAIGFGGQEVKHSRFLAFLLDPRQSHGLGDLFLKRVLREALDSVGKTSFITTTSLVALHGDLDRIDLGETLVRREHQYIDVLLTNEDHKLAVIIENKIWSAEHSNQLERYYQIVKDSRPGCNVLGIYLTRLGSFASREEDRKRYVAVLQAMETIFGDHNSSTTVPSVEDPLVESTGASESLRKASKQAYRHNAPVAQGTEQRTSNPPVAGSNPAGRAFKFTAKHGKSSEA